MKKKNKIILWTSFCALFFIILNLNIVRRLDFIVGKSVRNLYCPLLDKAMIFITSLINFETIIGLAIILFLYLVYVRKYKKAIFILFALFITELLIQAIKRIVHRARPENSLITNSGYSFPSSHAAIALVTFILLIYLFKDKIKNKFWKTIFVGFCIFAFLLIGFSRIYVNIHWLSDVIGGFGLGAWVIYSLNNLGFLKRSLTRK